jgi:hypothetical protein
MQVQRKRARVLLTNGTMIISEVSIHIAIVIMLVPGAIPWLVFYSKEVVLAL